MNNSNFQPKKKHWIQLVFITQKKFHSDSLVQFSFIYLKKLDHIYMYEFTLANCLSVVGQNYVGRSAFGFCEARALALFNWIGKHLCAAFLKKNKVNKPKHEAERATKIPNTNHTRAYAFSNFVRFFCFFIQSTAYVSLSSVMSACVSQKYIINVFNELKEA